MAERKERDLSVKEKSFAKDSTEKLVKERIRKIKKSHYVAENVKSMDIFIVQGFVYLTW